MFQDQKEKYEQFAEAMKDFKAQRTDTAEVIRKVKELFKGHNNLIIGFNTFLPKGYEITLEEKKTMEFEEAIGFVNKIRKRFQHDKHVYKSFLDILNMYRKEHKGITEVYQEVAALFDDHPDLLDEFTRFLPDNSTTPENHPESYNCSSFQRYDELSCAMPTRNRFYTDKQYHHDRMLASHTNCDPSVDRPDLEVDKAVTKMRKEQRKQAEKETRGRKHYEHHAREFERKRKRSRKFEGFGNRSFANEDDKNAVKSLYNREFNICEKVKERLSDPDEYQTFLKCINIYNTEIVSRSELHNLAASSPRLSIQLMNSINEKPEVAAVTLDPNFANYLSIEFLTANPSKRNLSGMLLQRNKRLLFGRLDESRDVPESMNCVKLMNGLEYKIVCNSSKISYVLDTEDYLFRSKRMRKNTPAENALRLNQTRLERFHRIHGKRELEDLLCSHQMYLYGGERLRPS